MKKITVKDIAALSGVSRGTVDRVLNNRGRVAEDTREIVWKVANQLGYKKNVIASSLASAKVVDIAVVFPIPREGSFWNIPIHGLQQGIDLYGHYGINLRYFNFNVDDEISFENKIEEAIQEKPNAILLAPLFLKETLKYLQVTSQNEIPVFTLNTEIGHPDIINYVGQNSYSCGKIAGRLFYLSNKKIKKIYCITPGHSKENVQHTKDKIDGLKKFFDEMNKDVIIEEVNVQNFDSFSAFSELYPYYAEDDLGLFITNSRIHNFLNDVNNKVNKGNNILIGFDLVPNNLRYLEEGKIDFLLHQNPSLQAKKALENIVHFLLFEKEIDRINYIPTDIILKENYKFYTE
jgi:LacI family transcriptional regulator